MRHALIGSVALHAALIAVAVERSTGPRVPRSDRERVEMVSVTVPVPAAEKPRPAAAKTGRRGFQVLAALVEIPTAIPDADITRSATDAADFSGRGVLSGTAGPSVSALPLSVGRWLNEPIDEDDVERAAEMLPGQMGPAYPDLLREAAPDGAVFVRFVIDTAGRLEAPSLNVVTSSHPLFTEAVRRALFRIQFSPAELAGRKVRVRVAQRFEFHLAHR